MRFDVEKKLFLEENVGADKIAFAAADRSLRWQELEALSGKICEVFKQLNIPAGYPVLVYGEKEALFLASVLSCYRMNLPFVPLTPSLPKKRIEKIIEQTKSRVLINCGNYENTGEQCVIISPDLRVTGNAQTWENCMEGTAYVLFTSGSSGEPKGVKITYDNVIAFIKWFVQYLRIDRETVFINQADFSFDISLADLFGTLHTGGTAVFNTYQISAETSSLFERINKYGGSYWNSTPSFVMRCLADKNFNAQTLPSVTRFVLSGEDLPVQLVKDLQTRFPKVAVVNAYGPTETTIYAGFAEITTGMLRENSLPICKEENAIISLRDDEIVISGNTVGAGYLNNEALTKEKFFWEGSKKSYRSGDRGVAKNGYIYFNGRKDGQIKFNGYRIELNEIKHALEKIDNIFHAECIPVVIDNKIKRLIAFITCKSEKINISYVLLQLKTELPPYMIPSEIVVLKEFPTTTSFKVDKQKLLSDYLSE
ncbi:MAG TPA: AMP-binding protein [Bacteroidia bacterium]|nr:AMP-binding protein [Bacteroidia bacterium]